MVLIEKDDKEKKLLTQLRAGDHHAFKLLYDRYKLQLTANFIRLLRDDELAKDALQELFIRIWNNREGIDLNLSFTAYIYQIARNLIIDYYRRALKDETLQTIMLQADQWYYHVEEEFMKKENASLLQTLIQQLPEQQRRAYMLHKIEEKSYKEICEIMQLSPSTINKHIHYAHRFITAQLIRAAHNFKFILLFFLI